MFSFAKESWYEAGVITVLSDVGLDKDFARKVTESIPKQSWVLINDCTNNLNQQCKNLMNTMFTVALYQYYDEHIWDLDPNLSLVVHRLRDAVEYQTVMGNEAEIDESQRRFAYVTEKYFDKEPSDIDSLAKSPYSLPLYALPFIEEKQQTMLNGVKRNLFKKRVRAKVLSAIVPERVADIAMCSFSGSAFDIMLTEMRGVQNSAMDLIGALVVMSRFSTYFEENGYDPESELGESVEVVQRAVAIIFSELMNLRERGLAVEAAIDASLKRMSKIFTFMA